MDIICLLETYIDSSIQLDTDNLKISGYNLVCSDHPSNKKRGGVYIPAKYCCLLESSIFIFCRNA